MENIKTPGKRFIGKNGYLCVNYHSTFFLMTRLGAYIPWNPTVHHGQLMPSQEWVRLRELNGGEAAVKDLTPFLNKRAAAIAARLKEDRFYKLTPGQKQSATENRETYLAAKQEGVSVEEFLHRKKVREQRAAKRASKLPPPPPAPIIPIKTENGKNSFFMGSVPGFEKLMQKIG